MKRRTFVKGGGTVAVGGLTGLAGCNAPSGDGAEGTTTETTPAGTTAEDAAETDGTTTEDGGPVQVAMISEGTNYYFDPIGLFVEPGTTVEWVNQSGSHSATAYAEGTGSAEVTRIPDDAEPWNSEIITEQGGTFSHTFEVEGTYDYFCIPHKTLGMVARIVCGQPGGVEGNPPDGEVPAPQDIVDRGSISYEEFAGDG
ncbi:plastocyanin/azurin family copper-binding protein [Halorussus pelagicus]|uniref:plastocyanin/azurin family copper-binding protein n=1 Tax=Halorussus pelagicus TaxID=2505977 RepID=UPI000FFB8D4F|nr:plastocyanin/azurin family copper-binding protein [Halorussus pelagicus]